MKKIVSLILALIMTTALLTIGTNATWEDDVQNKHLAEAELLTKESVKIFYSQSGGTKWMPANAVTRGYACRVAAQIALGSEVALALPKEASFSDVDASQTYAAFIKWCKDEGIVSGYADGTFGPAKNISRDAFLKIILGALNYKAAKEGYNKPEDWRYEVLTDAEAAGLLAGVTFNDVVKLRRDEAAKIVVNALNAIPVGGTAKLYETSFPNLYA